MELSFRKKLLFYGIVACFVWLFIEVLSYGASRIRYGTLTFIRGERQQFIKEYQDYFQGKNTHGGKRNWNVIHPYLGFVTEGTDTSKKCPEPGYCDNRIRTYEDRPFIKSTDENVIIGIVGGSFAGGISSDGGNGNFIKLHFSEIPRFRGKKIVLYRLAPGGYKQPQQLMKINYFLSLGAEFDIIINVDGFNEVAIPGTENLSKGVHPIFPRSWYYFADTSLNPELLALYGEKESYKLQQYHWAGIFSWPILNTLPSTNLIWKFRNLRLTRAIKAANIALVEYKENKDRKLQYATTGPDYSFTSKDDFYRDMAKIWSRSSLQLYQLCRGLGIEYYHFLQPNQYVQGSKILLEEEKKIAISADSKYGNAAREGYPFLIREGEWLKEQGVPFHDLTMIFKDTSKKLYIDNCCHLNEPGYSRVVKNIADTIRDIPTEVQQ